MNQDAITIGPEEIHVWTGHIYAESGVSDRMSAILSPDEIKRAESFHFQADRVRYIQARLMLRLILGWYCGLDARSIRFEAGAHGKPFCQSSGQIRFNLSHTREMAAVAVSASGEIGIDIEKQDDMKDMKDVAAQFMCREELQRMAELPVNLQKHFFYLCWVRKEALLKAIGTGLGDHMRGICVMDHWIDGVERVVFTNVEGQSRPWRLETFYPASDHVGAVCTESEAGHKDHLIQYRTIDGKRLFE